MEFASLSLYKVNLYIKGKSRKTIDLSKILMHPVNRNIFSIIKNSQIDLFFFQTKSSTPFYVVPGSTVTGAECREYVTNHKKARWEETAVGDKQSNRERRVWSYLLGNESVIPFLTI